MISSVELLLPGMWWESAVRSFVHEFGWLYEVRNKSVGRANSLETEVLLRSIDRNGVLGARKSV